MAGRMKDLLEELVPEKATAGEIVRAMRKREGFTLKEMEEITGIKESNLSALENGRLPMTQHYAEMLAVALNVHPTMFLYPDGRFDRGEGLIEIEKRAAMVIKRHA